MRLGENSKVLISETQVNLKGVISVVPAI